MRCSVVGLGSVVRGLVRVEGAPHIGFVAEGRDGKRPIWCGLGLPDADATSAVSTSQTVEVNTVTRPRAFVLAARLVIDCS